MRRFLVASLLLGCGAFSAVDEAPASSTDAGLDAGASEPDASVGADGTTPLPTTTFAKSEVDVSSIAVDDTDVFWVTKRIGGHVASCPKSGCPASGPRILADGQGDAHHVTMAGDRVAWLGNDRLRSAPKSGGAVFETTDGFTYAPPTSVVVVGTTAYVADGMRYRVCSDAFVKGCPTSAGSYVALSGPVADMRRSGSKVMVWSSGGVIRTINASGVFADVHSDANGVVTLAPDSEIFYVTKDGALRAVPLTGVPDGGAVREVASGLPAIVAIAVDAKDVFMVAEIAGKVLRVPRTGGGVVEMKADLVAPRALAIDGDSVWVAVAGTGDILRLAKQ